MPGAEQRAVRRSAEGALGVALLMLGAASLGAGLLTVTTTVGGLSLWERWVLVLIAWSYSAAGLVAWWRRPHNRMGPLLVAAGWSFFGVELAGSAAAVPVAVSLVVATLPLAIVLHLLMAFPSGRLETGLERWIVGATYGLATLLQAPQYLLGDGVRFSDQLALTSAPDAALALLRVQSVIGTLTFFTGAVILLLRVRSADAAQRRVVTPLCAIGSAALVVVGAVGFISAYDLPIAGLNTLAGTVQPLLLLVLPATFVFGLLRGGFARAGEVRELAARLVAGAPDAGELRAAIREALGDPTVALAFWVPAAARWVDADGATVVLPAAQARRAAVPVVAEGRLVGAIVYDRMLIGDAGLVRSVAQITALALDRQRLTAELRGAADELRASRQRLVVASDAERRRIARDVHDGAQQRLVLLALDAELLARDADEPQLVRDGAARLRAEAEAVLGDLRDLVHRIEPALLTERGLADAGRWLVTRLPIRAELHAQGLDERLPSIVETTGYFVLSEALANVSKHAGATSVRVDLRRTEDHVTIAIVDDGAGGADIAGSGLRGLADRVGAVGGRLAVDSPPGGGTRVEAELPIAPPPGEPAPPASGSLPPARPRGLTADSRA